MPSKTARCAPTFAPVPTVSASRASWTGQVNIAQRFVPVKAYPVYVTTPTSSLRQLHANCGEKLELQKRCPKHGPIATEDVAKGFSFTADNCVELTAEEIDELQPRNDKTIWLESFLRPEQLDLAWLSGRSLYLLPAHQAAVIDYRLILQALQKKNTWGLGYFVLSCRRQVIVVRPADNRLVLHVLNPLAQLRACPPIIGNPSSRIAPKDLRAVEKSIDAQNGPIRWEDYQDDFDARLAALVRAKLEARKVACAAGGNGRCRTKSKTDRHRSADRSVKIRRRRKAA